MNPTKNNALLWIIAGAILFGDGRVAAQGILEEIVVTAQRREESLQDTPVAVSAFTAEAIDNKGIEDISEVADFTPNLVYDTTSPVSGLSSGSVVFIRGIGNTDFGLTTDPGVGTYVDGVYVSRSAGGVLDVLDVERIEVLRGPQGTLFGRNTMGGAINITSRRPGDALQGRIDLTAGSFSRRDVRAFIDVPIAPTLRTTFAVSSKNRDGFVERVRVGDALGDENRLSFRGTAVLEPNEAMDFQLSVDYTDIDEQSAGSTLAGFTPGAGTLGYSLATFGDIPAGLADLSQYIMDGGDDLSFATGETGTRLNIGGVAFTANFHGRNLDVKYTAAQRETDGEFFRDADNSPHAITETLNPHYDHDQSSHELQVTGTALDGGLTYVAGLYYFDEQGTDDVFVRVFLPSPDLAVGFPAGISNYASVDNSSEAAYLQTTWNLTDIWSVTGGLRRTQDEKNYAYTQYIGADIQGNPLPFFPGAVNERGVFAPGLLPLVGNGSGTASDDFEETTYKLGVNANLADGTLIYYSFSQGFKSGGFVLRYVESVPGPRVFQPETIDAHEVGVKWQGLNDSLRINAAAFGSDYEDVQVTFLDSLGGPITANAGTVRIDGLELELTALVTANLRFEAGLGYVDAEYVSINPIEGLSLTLDESATLVNTPETSFHLGLEYGVPLNANELVFRTDYSSKDDMFNDAQNSPFLFQEAFATWNASVRFAMGESMDLVAFAENLTDERYIVSGDSNFGLGFHEANFNRPREYGITFRYRF
ncbi:MAG: TonB-dependent receptor [Candidatus Tectomicrobia bacterium]|nr:TonB-dependent receptor [Candidatus Tectomicrobia bacterium]